MQSDLSVSRSMLELTLHRCWLTLSAFCGTGPQIHYIKWFIGFFLFHWRINKNTEVIDYDKHMFFLLTKSFKYTIRFIFSTRTTFYKAIRLVAWTLWKNKKNMYFLLNGNFPIYIYKKENNWIGFSGVMS